MKKIYFLLLFNWSKSLQFGVLLIGFFVSSFLFADQTKDLTLQIEIPVLEADPYFRPYVAVWLETATREPVETLALWYQLPGGGASEDGRKWLKDLRQWWRKIGRANNESLDAVTGATRKPGNYSIQWNYGHLNPGDYFLHVEASREEGGRSFKRIALQITESLFISPIDQVIDGDGELGNIIIKVK